ncbi:MAG TPA: cytochrome c [Stellaceae bacterium]|jgi:cytochrome c556
MSSITKFLVLAAALAIVLTGASGAALAQDKETIFKNRQATMKEQGKDVGAVKAYLDGKGDLAQAKTGAANLTQTTKKIPELFPPGTGGPNPTGDYVAKPEIWTDWNKFLDAQKAAATKADTLLVAVNSGDKGAIEAAFNDLGKNGCGACHTTFREKIEK